MRKDLKEDIPRSQCSHECGYEREMKGKRMNANGSLRKTEGLRAANAEIRPSTGAEASFESPLPGTVSSLSSESPAPSLFLSTASGTEQRKRVCC